MVTLTFIFFAISSATQSYGMTIFTGYFTFFTGIMYFIAGLVEFINDSFERIVIPSGYYNRFEDEPGEHHKILNIN